MPKASANAAQQLEDLSSPVSAFARAACRVGVDPATGEPRESPYDDVYAQWVAWSELNGSRPTNKTDFTRDMTAAFPELVKYRPRVAIEVDGEKTWKSLPHRWKGIDINPEWLADRRADAAVAARQRREDEYADHGGPLD
jgi:phage/plasmid-associated DNA primase